MGSDSGIGIDPRIPLERVGDTQDLVTLPEEPRHMVGGAEAQTCKNCVNPD